MTAPRDLSKVAFLSSAPPETLVSHRELAVLLGCTTATLQKWEQLGKAPARFPTPGRPRYVLATVREWLASGVAHAA